jgi:hypothetical protein
MTAPSYIPTLLTLTAIAAFVACNPFATHQRVGQIDTDNSGASTQWNATLSTPSAMTGAVDLHGTASLAAHGEGKSVATVAISNAAPSGSHPWHVYEGHCGENGVVVGSATAYPLLNVNQQGTATGRIREALRREPQAGRDSGVALLAWNGTDRSTSHRRPIRPPGDPSCLDLLTG